MNESMIFWTFIWTCVGAIAAIASVLLALVPSAVREAFWYRCYEYLRQHFILQKLTASIWIRPRRKPIAFGFMLLGIPIGSIGVLLSAVVIVGVIYGIIFGMIPVLSGTLLALYFGAFGIYSYTFARDTTMDYLRLR
jgi:hypothetical protein